MVRPVDGTSGRAARTASADCFRGGPVEEGFCGLRARWEGGVNDCGCVLTGWEAAAVLMLPGQALVLT